MSAQPGDAILLAYGPQGDQQAGDAVLLAYGAAGATITVRSGTGMPWSAARAVSAARRVSFDRSAALDRASRARWGSGAALDVGQRTVWGLASAVDGAARMAWGRYDRRAHVDAHVPWGLARSSDHASVLPWARRERALQPLVLMRWATARRLDEVTLAPWGGPMQARDLEITAPVARADRRDLARTIPWVRYSRPLQPGWGIPTPPNPTPNPGDPVTILPSRYYMVTNEILFTRVSDSQVIPLIELSISIDADSWLPSFSASIPADQLSVVAPDPTPVAVEAVINGTAFRFLVEGISRTRSFGQSVLSISGRALAAELADPYMAPAYWANTEAANAQQLIDSALLLTGYTQDWQITDWLVPANAFQLTTTPAGVALRVAEAAGAVLQADWAGAQVLHMLPRYPHLPWAWGAEDPHYVLPEDLAVTESIEWRETPAYNAAIVMGQQYGIIGSVKREGTAGDLVAPMVTDPLATAEAMARQRGGAILAAAGRKALMTLSLPVLDETGILALSKLIEFGPTGGTRRGVTRAVRISVRPGSGRKAVTVRQAVTIEAEA